MTNVIVLNVFSAKRILTRMLSSVVTIIILSNVAFYFIQPRLIFYPIKDLVGTPKDWGLQYEEVTFQTDDQVAISAWWIAGDEKKKTLLFFHGNAGNMSHRRDTILLFNRMGYNVLIIDYRGYGMSSGIPSETGMALDAMAAWNYLLNERNLVPQQIIIYGRSLGGAVAVGLASRVRSAGLVLESTFNSVRGMAQKVLPYVNYLLWSRYTFNSAKTVKGISMPLLVLHSPKDEIIPYRLGRALYDSAPEPKRFHELKGGHNDGFYSTGESYLRAIQGFIDGLN